MISNLTTERDKIYALLSQWISRQLAPEQLSWLQQKQQQIASDSSGRSFFVTFSVIPRFVGKENLQLEKTAVRELVKENIYWFPQYWTIDRAVRTWLLLSFTKDNEQCFKVIEQLFKTADVKELVALYQMLPLLRDPERYRLRAAEGIRSNMTVVFNAVALRNPYPARYFDELAWNQMVLKALFVGSPLNLIQGLDRRTNPALAQMLIDYARERWAAGRSVSPELWRAVGEYGDRSILSDWERILAESDYQERSAVALACSRCSLPEAASLLAPYPDLKEAIGSGKLTWETIAIGNK